MPSFTLAVIWTGKRQPPPGEPIFLRQKDDLCVPRGMAQGCFFSGVLLLERLQRFTGLDEGSVSRDRGWRLHLVLGTAPGWKVTQAQRWIISSDHMESHQIFDSTREKGKIQDSVLSVSFERDSSIFESLAMVTIYIINPYASFSFGVLAGSVKA